MDQKIRQDIPNAMVTVSDAWIFWVFSPDFFISLFFGKLAKSRFGGEKLINLAVV